MSGDGVTYEFKDLFEKLESALTSGFDRMERRIDEINRRIDQKADNSRVAALEAKHSDFEIKVDDRFKPLEANMISDAAISKVQIRWLGFAAAFVTTLIGALIYVAASGGFH